MTYDLDTHLDLDRGGMTTADDFESGTAAAACGGITTICDYAWQQKGGETEATRQVIDYAELTDAEVYIVHMSCSGAADAMRAARLLGLRVWGETRPIYLGLTEEAYATGGVEAGLRTGGEG
jgi:dihydroorotase-like cyclic amidohydrolase